MGGIDPENSSSGDHGNPHGSLPPGIALHAANILVDTPAVEHNPWLPEVLAGCVTVKMVS